MTFFRPMGLSQTLMKIRTGVAIAGLAIAALMLAGGHADARQLSGNEIQNTISGKRIYLAVPLGGEFPLYYRTNGQVDGSGEALGLGRFMAPRDSGRWWVAGNQLCQQWREWYDGQQFCFTLSEAGSDRLSWVRNDGYSGTARIGN
ncbi:MAG: hypothetical protein AAFX39_11190 [Pseudomonadota bacterium]